jgi:hypothetical protein
MRWMGLSQGSPSWNGWMKACANGGRTTASTMHGGSIVRPKRVEVRPVSASPSPAQPNADATGRAKRAAAAVPRLLLALALASLAGFVTVAGFVLIYDTEVYGYGLLAGYSGSSTDGLRLALIILGLVVFAFATWRFGVVGAFVAFVGYVIIGPWLAAMSPLHDEPPVRQVCCDGIRSFQFIFVAIIGIAYFLIVTPITLIARWARRQFRHAA